MLQTAQPLRPAAVSSKVLIVMCYFSCSKFWISLSESQQMQNTARASSKTTLFDFSRHGNKYGKAAKIYPKQNHVW
jgi:hypothetical protein